MSEKLKYPPMPEQEALKGYDTLKAFPRFSSYEEFL